MKKQVVYILRKFPALSETFILNEILELEKEGLEVSIFSLKRANDPKFHPNLSRLKADIVYVPEFFQIRTLWKQRKKAFKNFGSGYRRKFWQVAGRFNFMDLFRFLQGLYIANRIRKLKEAHLHAHFATEAADVAYFAANMLDLPYSFTAHAFDIFKRDRSPRKLREKISRANFVITVSDYNKRFLSSVADSYSDKIIKVNNGIDLSLFCPDDSEKEAIFTFLTVARFVEKKGHSVLIAACRLLKERGLKFRLWLAGQGKLRKDIEKAIKKSGLRQEIKILGPLPQNEIIERYRSAHVFVLPCVEGKDGNKDGLPVSIVEALASGLPVITTPMTGNPEVIIDRRNGLLMPFGSALKLSEAMETLITDKSLLAELRKNARPSIEADFDIKRTTRKLISLFSEGDNQ